MSKSYPRQQPMAVSAYTQLADRYAQLAPTKPHNGLYERPASLKLLDAQAGDHVLDAGCGPGIASASLLDAGATVEGFDVTPRMIELAKERCAGRRATFRVADMAKLLDWLADGSFDRVLSSLAMDYVADLAPVFAEFFRVTRPGGVLVFSMAHPLSDWQYEEIRGDGQYFKRTKFGMYWTGFGEPKPYVESYRRPLGETLGAMLSAGWRLTTFHEPLPLDEMREVNPACYENLSRLPAFMCIRAVREG